MELCETRVERSRKGAAQPAVAGRTDCASRRPQTRASGRRVRGDQPRDARAQGHVHDQLQLAVIEVGRKLQKQWNGTARALLRQLAVALLKRAEERGESVGALKLAQVRRVRRADVDGDIVGVRPDDAEAREVVRDGGVDLDGAALADVDAEDAVGARPVDACGERGGARVEALSIEMGAVER